MKTVLILTALFSVATNAASVKKKTDGLTGAERICINRCEAKGWPGGTRCFNECMKRSR